MSGTSPSDLLAVAVEAARAAGHHALTHASRRREVAKFFKHDLKLVLDQESQDKAETVVRNHFPGHRILGEEGASEGEAGAPEWIIDPIDGTVNFSHGLTYWCSSVAVRVAGEVVAGATYAPVSDELFCATVDGPALCNGEPIHVSDVRELAEVVAFSGLEKTFDTDQSALEVVRAMAAHVRKIRLFGAAALDMCQVAAGRSEAFFQSGLFIWDVAAGALIVERAGGRAELLKRLDGGRYRYLITNGHVHDGLRSVIEKTLAALRV